MDRQVFKEWPSVCPCGFKGKILGWSYNLPLDCHSCGTKVDHFDNRPPNTVMIATDDIPGGVTLSHMTNADGSPIKVYSKTELRREANRRGLVLSGDTPKEYRVAWDGRRIQRFDETHATPMPLKRDHD